MKTNPLPICARECITKGSSATPLRCFERGAVRLRFIPHLVFICSLGGLLHHAAAQKCTLSRFDPLSGNTNRFGASADTNGDLAVVGAPQESSGRGAIYIYERSGDVWSFVKRIQLGSSGFSDVDTAVSTFFGAAVATDGTKIIVGAPGALRTSTQDRRGTAGVFAKDGQGQWVAEGNWFPGDVSVGFGAAVDISGNHAIVGIPQWNNSRGSAGAWKFVNGTWQHQVWLDNLLPSHPAVGAEFGRSVAIIRWQETLNPVSDQYDVSALVGAPYRGDGGEAIRFENPTESQWNVGSTYAVTPPVLNAQFGASVGFFNGANATCLTCSPDVLVGAPRDGSKGSIYSFASPSSYVRIRPSDTADDFGTRLASKGRHAVISDPLSDKIWSILFDGLSQTWTGTGANGQSGFATVAGDEFGRGVGISATTIIVGAPNHDGVGEVYFLSTSGADPDGDDWCSTVDNCPNDANADQADCTSNGIGDACEPDCNGNNAADDCDIDDGTSQDCNGTGIPDSCEIDDGTASDCNFNNIPDSCDIADGTSVDADMDGIPDECYLGMGDIIEPPQSIANSVDYGMSTANPSTAVFRHQFAGGNGYPAEDWLHANEPGIVAITWKDSGGNVLQTVNYVISDKPGADAYVNGVKYFLDWLPNTSAASIPISSPYNRIVHYNANITSADVDILVISGSDDLLTVNASTTDAGDWVVIEYVDGAAGRLMGIEAVRFEDYGTVSPEEVPIGHRMSLPTGADGCRAIMISNSVGGNAVAWQRGRAVLDSAEIYPVRPNTIASNFEIVWYSQTSIGEATAEQNCWPVVVSRHTTRWPDTSKGDDPPQTNLVDSNDPSEAPIVDLRVDPNGGDLYCSASIEYEEGFSGGTGPGAAIDSDGLFTTQRPGYSVLRFNKEDVSNVSCQDASTAVTFEVVATYEHGDALIKLPRADQNIGEGIDNGNHDSATPHYPYGYIHSGNNYAVTLYDPLNSQGDPNPDYTGQIILINTSKKSDGSTAHGSLEVWFFEASRAESSGDFAGGIYWPYRQKRFDGVFPNASNRAGDIDIAAKTGADSPDGIDYPPTDVGTKIYAVGTFGAQNTEEYTVNGWNPNDEHATLINGRVYAVRDDNPWGVETGHPYVLVQYPVEFDANDEVTKWGIGVHKVVANNADFVYDGFLAGSPIDPPLFPVNFAAAPCFDGMGAPQTYTTGTGVWVDKNSLAWAVEQWDDTCTDDNALDCTQSVGHIFLWENWATSGEGCQPWRDSSTTDSTPTDLQFEPQWPSAVQLDCGTNPDCAPQLFVGQTMIDSPLAVANQCGRIRVLHDSAGIRIIDRDLWTSAALAEPDSRDLDFSKLPPHLNNGELSGGLGDYPERVQYDLSTEQLRFRGIMSEEDRDYIIGMADLTRADCQNDPNDPICDAAYTLFDRSRHQLGKRCLGGADDGSSCASSSDCDSGRCIRFTQQDDHVVSFADADIKPGWVTLAFQNDDFCTGPVSVEVARVDCGIDGPFPGLIQVIEPKCPFSEEIVLHHTVDAGGKPENLSYQWQVSTDYDPDTGIGTWVNYQPPSDYANGVGLRDVVINGGANPVFTLIDTWWRVRYRGFKNCSCGGTGEPLCPVVGDGDPDAWPSGFDDPGMTGSTESAVSLWTDPQLAEGWVKRVLRKFNQFDQRIEEFHTTPAATYVNMIRQAGKRYEGPIALDCDPDNINALGLIETYQTVLRRAKQFLFGAGLPQTPDAANLALLLAATKISDLYMLLGNEAYADALDPTLGLFVNVDDLPSTYDPQSVFAFQGQVPTFLAEELALLHGRDTVTPPTLDANLNIIATVYNRLPWNFTSTDGQVAYANNYQVTELIDPTGTDGALIRYPQGHGDAWGHYLTAATQYYQLLTDKAFRWVVSTEAVSVAGAPVQVGFEHEREFAAVAAARARTGAAITSLTFRDKYSADPSEQNGYPDVDTDRAWGLLEWAQRSGQGAYVDWVVANSLIDDDDTDHADGTIQKVDRTTVTDIGEIAEAAVEIQSIVDQSDRGLNPLGLANNVVPFGINPADIEEGVTHFDQILLRAVRTLWNTIQLFQRANDNTQRLRSTQDDVVDFEDHVAESEADFTARLIEVFGRPYPDDVGPGKTYPTGYYGPDLFHYEYIEPSNLLDFVGVDDESQTYTVKYRVSCEDFEDVNACPADGAAADIDLDVEFNVSLNGIGLVKPKSWTSTRPEPGELQLARLDLLQALGTYARTVDSYSGQLANIDNQVDLIEQITGLNNTILGLRTANAAATLALSEVQLAAEVTAESLEATVSGASEAAEIAAYGIPKISGVGTTAITDAVGLQAAAAVKSAAVVANESENAAAVFRHGVASELGIAINSLNQGVDITVESLQGDIVELQETNTLVQMISDLATLEFDALIQQEELNAAIGRVYQALGKGLRILDERTAFRQRTARDVTQYRYQDMAFRIFRNDALQKYRAQFDLAARYAYLAAKAYDYETNLLGTDSASGQQFLTDIVKFRTLGQVQESFEEFIPQPGPGIAGALAALQDNFDVLRASLGFNNDAAEFDKVFSLRWENERISSSDDVSWRKVLSDATVTDIRSEPEYKIFALPLQSTSAIPGIVLRFGTEISTGNNFFGWPSTGDELYPTTYFAVKLHRVGLRFADYPGAPLNNQVECYLLPTGSDVMRVPVSCTNPNVSRTRYWNLLDQTLPLPNIITPQQFTVSDWMPWDGLPGGAESFIGRRRYPTILASEILPPYAFDDTDLSFMLIGRSAWNTEWTLIIPGTSLQGSDPDAGISTFIGDATDPGISDIKLLFNSYGYFGCVAADKSEAQQHAPVGRVFGRVRGGEK